PDEPGGELIGTLVAREYNERPWEEGGGCTGKWWRITELWEVTRPPQNIYVSLFIYKGFYGTATACDCLDVDMRSGGQLKISLSKDNNPQLSWYALVGKQYTVQYSETIAEGSWNNLLPEPLEVTGNGTVEIEDTSVTSTKRFYRLLIEDSGGE
ncbi:MAG: hypothetical protein KAX38_02700, partial [Candidatus Krumholzibacteria bacterium]|nr:hypothetical protein [Candidatus Krumholzibacteria bacterium]